MKRSLVCVVALALCAADKPATTWDEAKKRSVDQLIADLDDINGRSMALAALAERGPEALREAVPVLKTLRADGEFAPAAGVFVAALSLDPAHPTKAGPVGWDGNLRPNGWGLRSPEGPIWQFGLHVGKWAPAVLRAGPKAERDKYLELTRMFPSAMTDEVWVALAEMRVDPATPKELAWTLDQRFEQGYGEMFAAAPLLLKVGTPAARKTAIRVLPYPKTGDPNIRTVALPLIKHADPEVRAAAAEALLAAGDIYRALPVLLAHPWSEGQDNTPTAAKGERGDPVLNLPRSLQNRLTMLPPDRAKVVGEILIQVMTKDDPALARVAHRFAGYLGESSAPMWERLAKGDDPKLQALAKSTLARLGLPVEAVQPLAKDPDAARKAFDALRKPPSREYARRFDSQRLAEAGALPVEFAPELETIAKGNNSGSDPYLQVALCNAGPDMRKKYLPELLVRPEAPKRLPTYYPGSPKPVPDTTPQYIVNRQRADQLLEWAKPLLLLDTPAPEAVAAVEEIEKLAPHVFRVTADWWFKLRPDEFGANVKRLAEAGMLSHIQPSGFAPRPDPLDLGMCVKALADADPTVRRAGLMILRDGIQSRFAPDPTPASVKRDRQVRAIMRQAAKDEDEIVRGIAAFWAKYSDPASHSPELEPLISKTVKALKEQETRFRIASYERHPDGGTYVFNGADRELLREKLPVLVVTLGRVGSDYRIEGRDIVAALEKVGPECVPGLVKLLETGNTSNRSLVLELFGRFGTDAAEAVPAVKKLVGDKLTSVRLPAAAALARMTDETPAEARDVLKTIFDTAGADAAAYSERRWAEDPAKKPRDAAGSYQWQADIDRVKAAAGLVLADRDNRKTYLDALTTATQSKEPTVAAAAGKLLRELGPAARDAVPAIAAIAKDTPAAAALLRAIDIEAAKKAGVR